MIGLPRFASLPNQPDLIITQDPRSRCTLWRRLNLAHWADEAVRNLARLNSPLEKYPHNRAAVYSGAAARLVDNGINASSDLLGRNFVNRYLMQRLKMVPLKKPTRPTIHR